VSREVAKAFLETAFENWGATGFPDFRLVPFPHISPEDRNAAICNATSAMYSERRKVYCRGLNAKVYRPKANVLPILKCVLDSGVTAVSLPELTVLVKKIHRLGLINCITPVMVREILDQKEAQALCEAFPVPEKFV
jgi:hypothetical protein